MSRLLGCGVYEVEIRETGSDGQVGPTIERFNDITDLRWSRQLNRISTGSVSLGGLCCGPLTDWVQKSYCDPGEISIVRHPDGNEVFTGPLTSPEFGDETATLGFSDLLWWATGRALEPFAYGTAPADLTTVFQDGYEAAFRDQDPAVVDYLTGAGTGTFVDPEVGTYRMLWDQISDLQRQGLDLTQYGRETRFGPSIPSSDLIAGLTLPKIDDDDVIGEMKFRRRWDLFASRVIVQGREGVLAIASDPNCPNHTGRDLILSEPEMTQLEAQALADTQLALRSPAPLTITMPSGSWLRPETPICIDDLIPGALVPVCSDNACFSGRQLMQLVKVDVQFRGGQDEQVKLSFATPGSGSLNLGFEDGFRGIGREMKELRREVSRLRRQALG